MNSTGTDLALLILASLACVVVLTLALIDGTGLGLGGLKMRHVLIFAVVAGAVLLAGMVVWSATRYARSLAKRSREETASLRKDLRTAEAIIKAEPQILIFWEQQQGLRIVANTLRGIAGLPDREPELLRFGQWLVASSAHEMKESLDQLFDHGRPFNLLLKTTAGAHLEADGRATGGRAILRFRDVAGYKRDLVTILDQHKQLSREVRASRALLNALPIPVWLKDHNERIDWVNKAYVKSVGADDETEVFERQLELLEAHQRQEIAATIKSETRSTPYNKRLALIIDGERRRHDVSAVSLNDTIAAAAIDVEDIAAAKGELDRQIAAYDRTLHRVATAAAIFNCDQRLIFFNEAYRDLWQLDATWLKARPTDSEILDRLRQRSKLPEASDYRKWKANLLTCYTSDAPLDEYWHLPDGSTLHVMAEQRPDGGVTYLYENVTEQFAMESHCRALIDEQRETLDHLREGVALFATNGRLRLFNSAFAQIWKLSHGLLNEGPHIDELVKQCTVLFDEPDTWTLISRSVTVITDARQAVGGEMIRSDGSVINFNAAPMPDGATLVTFADVSAKKREELALIERNEALVAADKLKSQFISHVSYELRSPLTNIIGFSELLTSPRTGDLNIKQREYLGDITISSKQLLSIINDILDLTTIDAGALELKLTPVKVRTIIDSAALSVRDRAVRARLTLQITIAEDAVDFIADGDRVRQILYNLLSNAIGFSKPGDCVKLDCWRENAMMVFVIEDSGAGIPKEQQRRIFERFESSSRGSNHRGAGLGLSVVKSLVELHGGNITLHSAPGKGTRVTLRLPENGVRLIEDAAAVPQKLAALTAR